MKHWPTVLASCPAAQDNAVLYIYNYIYIYIVIIDAYRCCFRRMLSGAVPKPSIPPDVHRSLAPTSSSGRSVRHWSVPHPLEAWTRSRKSTWPDVVSGGLRVHHSWCLGLGPMVANSDPSDPTNTCGRTVASTSALQRIHPIQRSPF